MSTEKTENPEITRLKGEAKEQYGEATGDDELRAEGKVDQAQAKTKETVEEAGEKAEDVVEKAKGAVDSVRDKIGK